MPRHITITTPENVTIDYELAGLASRGGAAIVDLVLQGALISLVTTVKYLLGRYGKWPGATWPAAVLGIVIFAIMYGYYVYYETVWNGQTPGKRYARLRTVREGGLPVDLACAALRNLVRVVDFLPVLYALGAVVVVASSRNKRLGDYAAGTLVVKERPARPAEAAVGAESRRSLGLVKNIELVTPEEFAAAKRFVERKAELRAEVREELAGKIARPLMERLAAAPDGSVPYSAFLEELVARCVEERGMR
jgi:uncharacterized RDD family membrane protein YckC